MSDEKSFSVCQEMLPLFRAVLKCCFSFSAVYANRYKSDLVLVIDNKVKLNIGHSRRDRSYSRREREDHYDGRYGGRSIGNDGHERTGRCRTKEQAHKGNMVAKMEANDSRRRSLQRESKHEVDRERTRLERGREFCRERERDHRSSLGRHRTNGGSYQDKQNETRNDEQKPTSSLHGNCLVFSVICVIEYRSVTARKFYF